MRRAVFTFFLLGLLFGSVSTAQAAWRGYATVDVNMRTGPGVQYRVRVVVPRGGRLSVQSCRRRWCNVRWRRLRGWVSRRYIASARRYRPRRTYRRRPIYPPFYDPFYDGPYYDGPIYYPPILRRPGIIYGPRDLPPALSSTWKGLSSASIPPSPRPRSAAHSSTGPLQIKFSAGAAISAQHRWSP